MRATFCLMPQGFAGLVGLLVSQPWLFTPLATAVSASFRPHGLAGLNGSARLQLGLLTPNANPASACFTPQGFAGFDGFASEQAGLLKPPAICCKPWRRPPGSVAPPAPTGWSMP